MNRKMTFASLALSATLCSASLFAQAPTGKTVKFQVRNDTKTAIKLRAGDTHMTVAPGKTANVKLAAGQQILADETTPTFNEGTVVTTVSESMGGATLAVR